jgi:uncharacterized repeat protein (TIGR03803 family)
MRKLSFSPCTSQYRKQTRLSIETLGLLLLTSVVNAQTQPWGLTNVFIFQGGISGPDGGTPYDGLILGSDGDYYGTTWYGGTGGGTVFKVTPSGTESIVYAFSGSQDGQLPSKLVQGADGNFYGTTLWGGGPNGYGIIFKVTPSGEETILQSLTNTGGPANPGAGLTLGADGNFYGTSTGGGASGQGTFFQLTPAGLLTVLYSFGGASGGSPAAELIQVDHLRSVLLCKVIVAGVAVRVTVGGGAIENTLPHPPPPFWEVPVNVPAALRRRVPGG